MDDLSSTEARDAGLKPVAFYKKRMSPTRFQWRQYISNIIANETHAVAQIQQAFRTPFLDYYFLYTAMLGSHGFYVLCCPFPGWFGSQALLRDSVHMLGLGIYVTGVIKDYLCLPRPRSPPVHRLTLSTYTAEEYGCPSSHTANATSVCLLSFRWLYQNWRDYSYGVDAAVVIVVLLYFTTLSSGRIYCGMHGFTDVAVGAAVGASVFFFRVLIGPYFDTLLSTNPSPMVPLTLITVYYALIYYHPVPLDSCPCFEDGVAFIGVLMGLDFSYWFLVNYSEPLSGYDATEITPYDPNMGILKTVLRFIAGIAFVAVWKLLAKPTLNKLLAVKAPPSGPYAFLDRQSAHIIIKLIVYAGIPTAVLLCRFLFQWIGVGV